MDEYDYVIVGAGSAGCVLAARLSEDRSCSVLLLEAGGSDRHPFVHIPAAFPRLFKSALDWDYHTAPQAQLRGRALYFPRGKVVGGSSSINAMMWIRGFRADYDRWAELAGPEWSYDAVLSYFNRAEQLRGSVGPGAQYGRNGPIPIEGQKDLNPMTIRYLAAADELGLRARHGPNSDLDEGVYATRVTQEGGRRVSAADAYLAPARSRRNLTVQTRARALRVELEQRRATGVSYERGGAVRQVRARREVLLAAGAIGSPQLLLCSGIGPARELREIGIEVMLDAPEVGKNLQDHLTAGFAIETTERVTLAGAQSPIALAKYVLLHKGLLTSNIAEAYGYVKSRDDLDLPDLELLFVPGPFINEGLTIEKRHGVTFGAVLLQPESRGEVRVTSPDARERAIVDPRYLSDENGTDRATLRAGIARCLSLKDASPFANVLGAFMQPSGLDGAELIEESLERYAQTLYHPVGTARMGNDASSVVDAQLRVRGIEALRVIDASVMPIIPRAHTHAPTVMIAEKAADLLRRN
jgi:choline dehydrogenase